MDKVVDKIDDVWGDYDDFERGGFQYVSFVIEKDLEGMELDQWDEEECIEELCDIAINSIRMIEERGYDGEKEILDRLDNHEEKGLDRLYDKYWGMWMREKRKERGVDGLLTGGGEGRTPR